MPAGPPRILIIRLSAIGDVARVIPALNALREHYPNARIDWAVERKAADLLEGQPALDEVLVFNRPEGARSAVREFLALCRRIRRNRYDIVLDFHGIFKSGLISAFSGAPQRLGFARPRAQEGSAFFAKRRVRLPEGPINREEENRILCGALGLNGAWPSATICVPPDIQEAVDAFFDAAFDGGKYVVAMHVPVDRPEKQWPLASFAGLADLLQADGRFEVILTWGPGQLEVVREVAGRCRRAPIIAPATPDLKHFAWLVHRCALYFGGDTGPMHMAALMGTPVVAVFIGTDPARHAPYQHPHRALVHSVASNVAASAIVTPEIAYRACIEMVTSASR